jgi:putative chitinase
MLSREILERLYPRAPLKHLDAFARDGDELFRRFEIAATPNRLHFFLAQVGHESAGLTLFTENLNYRAARILEVWPTRFADLVAAQACERNPEALANRVYCERMGNGATDTGDGWRYRGRGYIQITGRDAYRAVGRIAELDLETDPDLAAAPGHALHVACGFWRWKRMNELCDSGNFVDVTRRINGGTNGLEDREAWLAKVRQTLSSTPVAEAVHA